MTADAAGSTSVRIDPSCWPRVMSCAHPSYARRSASSIPSIDDCDGNVAPHVTRRTRSSAVGCSNCSRYASIDARTRCNPDISSAPRPDRSMAASSTSAMRSCAAPATRATRASLDPKWCVGRPRLVPARSPMTVREAPLMPRSAMTSEAAASRTRSDSSRRSTCVRRARDRRGHPFNVQIRAAQGKR